MGDFKNKISNDYPDHLNPFEENYNGIPVLEETKGKKKYNTWGANRGNQVVVKQKEKPSFLEKPWAALNISPRNKVVRRLSFLKTAVERLTPRKKRDHSASFSEKNSTRSHSLHGDFSFRIVSPKQKEKLRQQAFPALARQEQTTDHPTEEASNSNHINGRLTPTGQLEEEAPSSTPTKEHSDTLSTPEGKPSESCGLGQRSASMRRSRKKRRPPPPPPPVPPPRSVKPNDLTSHVAERADDAHSACSSITQDLERSLPSGDESSLAEFEFDRSKLEYEITDIK